VDVSIKTIEQMAAKHEEVDYRKRIGKPSEIWNLKLEFFRMVEECGGFACHHAHLDKAYLISFENLKLSQVDMQKKWHLYKYLKENYTFDDLVERISMGVQRMIDQGVTYFRTMVDADATVKLLPLKAAVEAKNRFKDEITMEIAIQPLEGLLDKTARNYFVKACEVADCIGGLPSKDRPQEKKHLDYLMGLAKDLGKNLDVHVDQENNPDENETELLALKTKEYGLEGRVNAVHAISVAAKPEGEQNRIIKLMKDAGLGVIVCPSAALSMKQLNNKNAPLHNSIAPIPKFLDADIPVYLGVDNIYDLFMPFTDGDMWMECRMLMEACRFYDIEKVAEIACRKVNQLAQIGSTDTRKPAKLAF
jgi:cytosine/adenosine deaminase-related metal-dependent hydrolase